MYHPHVSVDVYLLGKEEGVQSFALTNGCKYDSDIEYNKYGTPLVSSIFNKIKQIGKQIELENQNKKVVCCYINADIITFNCFLENIYQYHHHQSFKNNDGNNTRTPYLLVGMRWNVDGIKQIDFDDNNWTSNVIDYAQTHGESHGCWGIDYFIFPPDTFKYIYPFALGKFVWDRWLVGNVYRRDSITVDISNTNFVIHQNGMWYQSSTGGATKDRKSLYDTDEVNINHSFDYYEKDIYTGTRWETQFDTTNNKIVFIEKSSIPRKD